MASRKFELSREGKDLRLSMAQGDITLTRLATAFQVVAATGVISVFLQHVLNKKHQTEFPPHVNTQLIQHAIANNRGSAS